METCCIMNKRNKQCVIRLVCLLHGGQVSEHHIHCVHWVGADGFVQLQGLGHAASSQHLMQHVPADQRHKLNGDFKRPVFTTFSWQRDIQVNL